jgi:isocitrate lyase
MATNGNGYSKNGNGNGNGASPQAKLESQWKSDPRWEGVTRSYTATDVERLRGSFRIEHTLARLGAERLWTLLHEQPYVAALGAVTGNQAVQQVKAGLPAIYVSGWQVAADANAAAQTYPDQSLYPADSVPNLVRRINQALLRADEIHHAEGKDDIYWLAPMVADAEAGFGGNLNAFELMKQMIEAGEEVRTPRRQSAGADGRRNSQANRGAARGGRDGRAHAAHGAHGRGQRDAPDERH